MQEYEVKRGYTADLQTKMVQELRDYFNTEPQESGGHYRIQYGALRKLEVWVGKSGKSIVIDTEANPEASDEEIIDTNQRFRRYLDTVTGFTTKERVKRAKKAAEG
ncbi:MAG TPA: DUF5611 family protein [Methanomicrobiales archaeon]|nr:DUF5611 family protein [Methanomicrobiales archaeon]